jgi:hypothetical protein
VRCDQIIWQLLFSSKITHRFCKCQKIQGRLLRVVLV